MNFLSLPSAGNFVSAIRRPLQPWNYEIMQNMFHARFKFNGRGGNAEEQGRDATTG